jgi:hypothetical protein
MQGLRESQLATALNDFTPENMLRLVRLAMPNIIRNKVFTEFALTKRAGYSHPRALAA